MTHNQKPFLTISPLGALVAAAFMSAFLIGCGPEPFVDKNRTSISGVVTFNGTPLKAGTIRFDSNDKAIGTSTSIGSDGRYGTNRIPLGQNTVTIETESLKYGSPHLYTKIPEKYADPTKSGLTVDVKEGTNENVNFELKP
jgi:hypothetical protein